MNDIKHTPQALWTSKWAFILATTGAAVGLGNIWRFPYMVGVNGGSAFVLLYLLFVALIGLPTMVAEIIIGRHARANPVDALERTAIEQGHTKQWKWLGWWGALGLVLVLSFYSVVAGWSIAYLFHIFSGSMQHMNAEQIHQTWDSLMSQPIHMLGWHTVFMTLTMTVILFGVQQGLERATKFMMPALYLILFGLVIYSAITGDFSKAFNFLFHFDLSKITTSVVIAAMGHAFFTLALGAGAMLMYGAYVPNRVNIIQSVVIVAGLDVLVAVLSGLAIFPLVFEYNLPLQEGPGLMFTALPIAFAHMPGGMYVGGLFFLLLLFAAWTSSINIAEPLIVIVIKKLKRTRAQAAVIVGFIAWFLGIGSILSFNLWKHVKLFNKFTLFDIATNLPTDIILPIGGLGFAVFAGWVMSKKTSRKSLNTKRPWLYYTWLTLTRFVAPLGIFIVFVTSF